MDKIISLKRYICGSEEFNFSELYRNCTIGTKNLPVNVFMLEHKRQGTILINTGCSRLLRQNPTAFANLLMRSKLSFKNDDGICSLLSAEKTDPICVRKVLLSHCDPECCGALPLLPKYELISGAQVLSVLWYADASDRIMKSTLPPAGIPKRAAGIFKGKTFLSQYFKWVYDIFNDGSILAVDISGHAKAMVGFYLPEKKIFFAADASIDETAIEQPLIPSDKLLGKQFYPDDYLSVLITLRRIHKEHPEIRFLFSHSESAITFPVTE